MSTTLTLESPEILKVIICYHRLSVSRISKIMHCVVGNSFTSPIESAKFKNFNISMPERQNSKCPYSLIIQDGVKRIIIQISIFPLKLEQTYFRGHPIYLDMLLGAITALIGYRCAINLMQRPGYE